MVNFLLEALTFSFSDLQTTLLRNILNVIVVIDGNGETDECAE